MESALIVIVKLVWFMAMRYIPINERLILDQTYLDKQFYLCNNDKDHYVGTYDNSTRSLGRLANADLRKLKHLGHSIFDRLWKIKSHFKS